MYWMMKAMHYIYYEIEYSIIEYSIFHDSQKYKIKKN